MSCISTGVLVFKRSARDNRSGIDETTLLSWREREGERERERERERDFLYIDMCFCLSRVSRPNGDHTVANE